MAGTLTISTLSDGTNSTSSTNCIQGSAKAWVNFNGDGSTSIRGSYNVSSVTYSGTGYYTIAFTSALPDANYSVVGSARPNTTGYATVTFVPFRTNGPADTTPTSSGFTVATPVQGSTNGTNCNYVCISVFR